MYDYRASQKLNKFGTVTTSELLTQSAERKAQQCVKWPEKLGKSVSVVDANAWGIMHWRSFVFCCLSSLLSVSVIVPWLFSLCRCTHTVWLTFESLLIPWSSSWFMRAVSVASDLFDFSIQFISFLIITLITLLFLLPDTFNFHDVVDKYPAYFRWGPWHPGRERASHTHSPRTWPMHNNDRWFCLGWSCARHSSDGGRISAKPIRPVKSELRVCVGPLAGIVSTWFLFWPQRWVGRGTSLASKQVASLTAFGSLLFAEREPQRQDQLGPTFNNTEDCCSQKSSRTLTQAHTVAKERWGHTTKWSRQAAWVAILSDANATLNQVVVWVSYKAEAPLSQVGFCRCSAVSIAIVFFSFLCCVQCHPNLRMTYK